MLEFSDLVQIERAKTAVGNGRLFNVLMFALIVIVAVQIDIAALWLAFAPVVSIGAAYLADGIGARFQRYLSIASIAFAISAFLVIIYI
jgi:hypothetical protein